MGGDGCCCIVETGLLEGGIAALEQQDMTGTITAVEYGSANVFADLGMPEPESQFLKAQLLARLAAVLKDQGLTQADAAQRVGVSQPDISRLLRGRFWDISAERLVRMLVGLGCAVEIVVRLASGGEFVAPISVG